MTALRTHLTINHMFNAGALGWTLSYVMQIDLWLGVYAEHALSQ